MERRLRTNVAANVLNAGAGLAVAAISTPLILDRLGKAAFGIWTILASFVVYLAIAESGFGPAIQRFVAVARGRGDEHAPLRLMWTAACLYLVVGGAAGLILWLLAPDLVGVFDFPTALHDDAVSLTRAVAVAIPVSLVSTGLGNVLFGLERFVAAAVSSSASAIVLLAAIVATLASDRGLPGLGLALIAQQATSLVIRAGALRDLVASRRPGFATRAELRDMVSFSARLQVSALSILINGQSDKVVVGLVAPATTVAQLGIAGQLAEAGRLVGGAMLQPVVSRLAVVAGQGQHESLAVEYRQLSRIWIIAVTGATAVGIAVLHPFLLAWLGPGYGKAVALGSVLVLAYGINVITGIGSAYLRAIGMIGIEARAGVLMVALNVCFTIPLALAAGALGVVLGTLAANVFGTTWFFSRLHRVAPFLPAEPWRAGLRQLALAALAAAVTLGTGWAAADLLPRLVAIVPVAVAAAASLGAYLAISLRVSLRPSALRRLLGPQPIS